MNIWEAAPLIGVNGITFGMPRDAVRTILGPTYIEFRKSKFSRNSSDDFGVAHVYYDADNKCNAIEIFSDISVSIGGQIVFPGSVENLTRIIPDLTRDDSGYCSVDKSIGVYVVDGRAVSILFGNEGYYE